MFPRLLTTVWAGIRLLDYIHSLRSKTARNILVVFGGNVLGSFITALAALVIIRNLSKAEYGAIMIFQTTIALAAGLILQGLNWALIKQAASAQTDGKPQDADVVGTVFWVQTGVALTLLILGWLGAPMIAEQLLQEPALVMFVRWGFVAMVGTVYMQFASSVLQARNHFISSSGILLIGAMFSLCVNVLLLVSGQLTMVNAIIVFVIAPFLGALVGLVLIRKGCRSWRVNRGIFSKFVSDSRWMLVYTLLLWAYSRLDILMLTRYRSLDEVAIYGAANKIYAMILLGLHAINTVLLPRLSADKNPDGLRRFIVRYYRMMVPLALVVIPVFLVTSPWIIWLLVGPEYDASVPVLQVLLTSATLGLLFSPMVNVLFAVGWVRVVALFGSVFLIVGFSVQFLLTSSFGALGAAWATLIAYLTLNVACALGAWRLTRTPAVE
jgi:O-antigen/teichoic acid export membrane protein